MPDIRAFRGVRYDLGQVGSLSDVVAPWDGALSEDVRTGLYKQHPANAIRLIRNREEPADEPLSRFNRAAKFLRNWRRQGVLMQDASPAIYVYHQSFDVDGVTVDRRGFAAGMRLEALGASVRALSEQDATNQQEVAHQSRLLERCQMNLTPIVAVYPDDTQTLQNQLDALIYDVAPREAKDADGVIHRLWPVTDLTTITSVVAYLGGLPVNLIAGREIYQAAVEYRDQLPDLDDEAGANYALTFLMNMQSAASPTLPVVCQLDDVRMSVDDIAACLQGNFDLEALSVIHAEEIWEDLQLQEQPAAACYSARDQRWVMAKLSSSGRLELAKRCGHHSAEWQGLNVSVFHRLLLPSLTTTENVGRWSSAKSPSGLIRLLESFETGVGVAGMVVPPNADDLRWFSNLGEPLPDLAAYGRPLPVSGLVFHPVS